MWVCVSATAWPSSTGFSLPPTWSLRRSWQSSGLSSPCSSAAFYTGESSLWIPCKCCRLKQECHFVLFFVCSWRPSHSCYIAVFIYLYTWSFYTASVLVGVAAAGTGTPNSLFCFVNRCLPSSVTVFSVLQCCGRLRETFSPSTPLTAPSEEIVAFSGRWCSSGKPVCPVQATRSLFR